MRKAWEILPIVRGMMLKSGKTRCPIKRLRRTLVEGEAADTAELDAIEEEIRELVAESHKFAEASSYPDGKTATDHIYSEPATDSISEPLSLGDRETTFVGATLEALDEAMAADDTIFVMGEGAGERVGISRPPSDYSRNMARTGYAILRYASADLSGLAVAPRCRVLVLSLIVCF